MPRSEVPARLIVDAELLLYIGPVDLVSEHRCAGTVVAFGVDGDFSLRLGGHDRQGRWACAPGGLPRAVDAHGLRLAVTLFDPGLDLAGPVDGERGLHAVQRLAVAHSQADWIDFRAALGPLRWRADDPRVRAAAARLRETCDENLDADTIATPTGLSASRLQHLFKAQLGLSMRAYRNGFRFRRVVQRMADGVDATQAAHEAGFFDSAHLVHAFRQSFGITPTFVFRPGLQCHAVA